MEVVQVCTTATQQILHAQTLVHCMPNAKSHPSQIALQEALCMTTVKKGAFDEKVIQVTFVF